MSKFKVGDKLVALESVKTVGACIPQAQLDLLPGVVAEVKEVDGRGSFSVVFDGCTGSLPCGWWFNSGDASHFVKIPKSGDVVTELVIPEGKSLEDINISERAGNSNPVGGFVTSTNARSNPNNTPWFPQDAYISTGYFWPVSWLRFKYQDEQKEVNAGKSFSDLKPGDKVKWVGDEFTKANGYNGISAETMLRVAAQPYLTLEDGVRFKYADGTDWWLFKKGDYGTLYVDYVEPAEAAEPRKFQPGDKVRFKSRQLSELKGRWTPQKAWCGRPEILGWPNLSDDHVFTVSRAPYLSEDGSKPWHDVILRSPETGGGWYSLACDLILVKEEPSADISTAAGLPDSVAEQEKVKLTKQQKSAKRLSKYIHKAQVESRVLRDLSVARQVGEVNLAELACRLHEPKRQAREIIETLGLEIEDWESDC